MLVLEILKVSAWEFLLFLPTLRFSARRKPFDHFMLLRRSEPLGCRKDIILQTVKNPTAKNDAPSRAGASMVRMETPCLPEVS